MNWCIVLAVIGLIGYANSQRSCGNCFPGTSTSLCPYRKATDPIICDQFRRKYTPCTFSCINNCSPGLRIEGCGPTCAPSSGPCTSTTPITQCLPDTTAPCNVPFVAPKGACEVDSQSESCLKCQIASPAIGMCDPGVMTCTLNTLAPCNVAFVPPLNATACTVNKTSVECTKCRATSMAKGGCI